MSTAMRNDEVWKQESVVRKFLEGVRGGIPLAAEQLHIMTHIIRQWRPEVQSFLDLGCGNGILSATVLAAFPNSRGMLVDFSQPMLAAARSAMGEHASRIECICADLATSEWSGSVRNFTPVDLVISGFAIHHLTDERKKALYREIHDLLNPGGVFLNLEHVASATQAVGALHEELFIDSIRAFVQSQGVVKSREEVARDYINREDQKANILAPAEAQCDWLRETGFADVDCYFKVFELALIGGRRRQV